MLGSLFGIDPEMGAEPLLKSFIIVQIGGMGSIAGTVLAGLFIGLSDSATGTLRTRHLLDEAQRAYQLIIENKLSGLALAQSKLARYRPAETTTP